MPLISLTNFVILSYKPRLSLCIRLELLFKNVPDLSPGNSEKQIFVILFVTQDALRFPCFGFRKYADELPPVYQLTIAELSIVWHFPVERSLNSRVLRWT
jgi:hypothetical protein